MRTDMKTETAIPGIDGQQILGRPDKVTKIIGNNQLAGHIECVVLGKLTTEKWHVPASSQSSEWRMGSFTTQDKTVWTASIQGYTSIVDGRATSVPIGNRITLEEVSPKGDVRTLTVESPYPNSTNQPTVTYSEKIRTDGEDPTTTFYDTNTQESFDGARALSEGLRRLNGEVILVRNAITSPKRQQVWPPLDEDPSPRDDNEPLPYALAFARREAARLNGPQGQERIIYETASQEEQKEAYIKYK